MIALLAKEPARELMQSFSIVQRGEEAVIAAGSVVSDNAVIPPRHLVAGIPAKVIKEISRTSLWYVQTGYKAYHELRDEYLKQGIGVITEEAL